MHYPTIIYDLLKGIISFNIKKFIQQISNYYCLFLFVFLFKFGLSRNETKIRKEVQSNKLSLFWQIFIILSETRVRLYFLIK